LNKRSSALASALFFFVFLYQIINITGNVTFVSQNLTVLSSALFSTYLIPFELISVILVGSIIAMFHVAGGK
jgi:NADH-quinone oxidoreductase subunit J